MIAEKIVTVVFGSSRPKAGDAEYEEARELGKCWPSAGFAVCSGGFGGVMEGVFARRKRGRRENLRRDRGIFSSARPMRGCGHGSADGHLGRTAFELVRLADGFAV